jgi:hypothetical protein
MRFVELGLRLEALAARVLDGARRLLDQEALLGDRDADAAAGHLAGQAEPVAVGVEPEEREAEAVLAARGAVAGAGVAAGAHEDGHHVELEADRAVGGGCFTSTGT